MLVYTHLVLHRTVSRNMQTIINRKKGSKSPTHYYKTYTNTSNITNITYKNCNNNNNNNNNSNTPSDLPLYSH